MPTRRSCNDLIIKHAMISTKNIFATLFLNMMRKRQQIFHVTSQLDGGGIYAGESLHQSFDSFVSAICFPPFLSSFHRISSESVSFFLLISLPFRSLAARKLTYAFRMARYNILEAEAFFFPACGVHVRDPRQLSPTQHASLPRVL